MVEHHSRHEFKRHVRVYIAVFVALLVGTVITVAAWKWGHFETMTLTVAVALFIATIKAFLVAGYFMHLMSERKTIYAIMAATVFFFAGMMYLTVWSREQLPRGSEYWGPRPGPETAVPKAQE